MIERTEAEIMRNWKDGTASPLASICIRTYNLENFVAEALDSFLMQETDFCFEIVIDDDCSSDGTVGIIKKYIEKFPNIINANLREENIGTRLNFIKNFQRAKGKYIAPCDGDDYWTDPLNLQKHIAFLEKNDEYVVTYSSMETIFEDESKKRTFKWNTEDRESLEIQKFFLGTGICTLCFRNVDIIKEYPFEHHCAPIDDNFLGSMLGAYGKGKFLKDIKAAIYRHHGDSDYSSKSIYDKAVMYEQTFFALYIYYLRIGNKPLSEHFYNKVMEYSLVVHGKIYYTRLLLKSYSEQMISFFTMTIKVMILKILKIFKVR